MNKRILLLMGGTWHDFEGFAQAMRALATAGGYELEVSYDPDSLLQLSHGHFDVVLDYTCMTADRDGRAPLPGMSAAQVEALGAWVRAGGALLAAHAATVLGTSPATLGALMGGVFVSHPPAKRFTVSPLSKTHPITAGIEAFVVDDELYMQNYEPNVEIHMIALDGGVAHPMVWSKAEGAGRVAHVALGHSQTVWSQHPYQRLMVQALDWLAASSDVRT